MIPLLTTTQKKSIFVYIISTVLAWIISMIPIEVLPVYNFSALIYIAILIGWVLSLHRRIVHPVIRRLLVTSAVLMASLFYLRICRYTFFVSLPYIRQYFWYMYYIPFTGIPLLALFAAFAVDTPEDVMTLIKRELRASAQISAKADDKEDTHYMKYVKAVIFLTVVWILLCIAIMTNDIHGQMFHIKDAAYEEYSYGVIYIVIVIWETLFSIASFSVMMRKCRLSATRRYRYIPVIPSVTSAALMILYIIVGGSPTIFGIRLYKIQEAFCLLYVGLFEGSIAIGLIPSNSGYEELFELSHIDAAIIDSEGGLVYRSHNYTDKKFGDVNKDAGIDNIVNDKNDRDFETDEFLKDACVRYRENDIIGGRVLWTEDLSGIAGINENIRIATEQIEEENDLIEQENRIAAERAVYEAKNRLYDKIAGIVRGQADEIEKELRCDDSRFYDNLRHSVVLASYIKRRGNLILIADGNPRVSTDELALAIRESFEYLELSEKYTRLDVGGETKISSELIMYAYDMFEEIVENTYNDLLTILVRIEVEPTFTLQVLVALKSDVDSVIDKDWNRDRLSVLGAGIVADYVDETWHVTMHTGREVRML